jgi:hypothetical protein
MTQIRYKGMSVARAFDGWWKVKGSVYGSLVVKDERARKDMLRFAFNEGMRVAGVVDVPEATKLLNECRGILFESASAESFGDLIERIDQALASTALRR